MAWRDLPGLRVNCIRFRDLKQVLGRRTVSLPLVVFGLALGAIVVAGASAEGSESPKSVIRPCPNKPNCVSSRAPEGPRRMDPIRYQGSVEDARAKTSEELFSPPRVSTVVQNGGNYLKVEFRSAIFSFVDDVEFEFDDVREAHPFSLGFSFRILRLRSQPKTDGVHQPPVLRQVDLGITVMCAESPLKDGFSLKASHGRPGVQGIGVGVV